MSELIAGNQQIITDIQYNGVTVSGIYKGSEQLWPYNVSNYTWGDTNNMSQTISDYVYVSEINLYIGIIIGDYRLYSSADAITWSIWHNGYTGVPYYAIGYNKYGSTYKILALALASNTTKYLYGIRPSTKAFTEIYSASWSGTTDLKYSLPDGNVFLSGITGTTVPKFVIADDSYVNMSNYNDDSTWYTRYPYYKISSVGITKCAFILQHTDDRYGYFHYGSNSVQLGYYATLGAHAWVSRGGGKVLGQLMDNANNRIGLYTYDGTTLVSAGTSGTFMGDPLWVGQLQKYVSYSNDLNEHTVYYSEDGFSWTSWVSDSSLPTNAWVKYFPGNNTIHVLDRTNYNTNKIAYGV